MLARTLQQLIEEEHTSVSEVAELAGVSNSTVYRWIARRSQPDFDAIRRVIRGLPSKHAQRCLLSVITTGTNWRLRSYELHLDINRDGKIDAEDALDATIRVVRSAGQSLASVRSSCAAGSVQKQDLVDLVQQLNDVVQHSTIVQEILVRMVDQRKRRRVAAKATNGKPVAP
jgi:transposase